MVGEYLEQKLTLKIAKVVLVLFQLFLQQEWCLCEMKGNESGVIIIPLADDLIGVHVCPSSRCGVD